MLAERAVHPNPIIRVERRVPDLTRDRVTEIHELALPVAKATRTKSHDRLVVGGRRKLENVLYRKRPSCDREPVDDDVLGGWQLPNSIAEQLLERRGKGGRNRLSSRSVRTRSRN